MLNHPDAQVQYIFTILENHRDNLIVENGNLSARIKELESQVSPDLIPEPVPAEEVTEPPVN